MPLRIDGRVPARWAAEGNSRLADASSSQVSDNLRIAFINNMPDAALEDTESQFFTLLETASAETPVEVKLYSLPGVPRGERGERHLGEFYNDFDDLWKNHFDGVIITGTEPRQPNLRNEPYWGKLAEVFDWAERNTASALLSCLAAHASVLHSDGIPRRPLPDKQFGVFESAKTTDHPLMNQTPERVRFPHSRWNEVREDNLVSAGYTILAKSADAGVDTFVKQKRESLFLHFQGHPEYGAQTLFKEYRRDIKRYLNRERETYPTMPFGYFDAASSRSLGEFRKLAIADPREEVMAGFPEDAVVADLQNGWHATAACVYRNWLRYLTASESNSNLTMVSAGTRRNEAKPL